MPLILAGATSGSTTLSATDAVTVNATIPAGGGTLLSTTNPQSGGVIQVVQATYSTQASTSSTSFTNTGLAASITPKFSTSKILVISALQGIINNGNSSYSYAVEQLLRGASSIAVFDQASGFVTQGGTGSYQTASSNTFVYLDSPATTSSTTYTLQIRVSGNSGGSGSIYWSNNNATSTMTLMEIAA